jgi:hypothetical protein
VIVIQAGHLNIENNCDPLLRTATGAPGEATWTPRIADRIVEILTVHGVEARKVDANFNCDANVGSDYAAVVAIHYRGNSPTASGFFVGPGDPAEDKAAGLSASLAEAVKAAYSEETGLTFRPEWNSQSIIHNYVFEKLSAHSPSCLLEAGVGWGPDRDFIHSAEGMESISRAIARGVLAFLKNAAPAVATPAEPAASSESQSGIAAESAPPSPDTGGSATEPGDAATQLADACRRVEELQRQVDGLTSVLNQLTHVLKG